MPRIHRISFALLILALCAYGCSSDSGGGSDNTDAPPVGSSLDMDGNGSGTSDAEAEQGDGVERPPIEEVDGTIKGLQLTAEAAGCSEEGGFPATVAESVAINKAVVTSPRFVADEDANGNPELDGYYVWDNDQAPWSGIMLTVPSSENTNFKPGDTLSLVGDLKEAWCNTQLSIEASGYELVETVDAPVAVAIDAQSASFEPYEGMLVSLSDVAVESETTWGGYVLEGGMEVSYGFDFFLSMEVGERYDITGQIRYAYGSYQLLPRYESDLGLTGEAGPIDNGDPPDTGEPVDPSTLDGTIEALQTAAEAAGCTEDDTFPATLAEAVSVTGAVVTSPRFIAYENSNGEVELHGYYVWDNNQADWSGILLTIPASENTNFGLGDTLTLSGELKDAWCNTQLSVEANGYELTDTVDMPLPVTVDAAIEDMEPYEGMLISLSGVLVESETTWGGYVLEGGLEVSYGFDFFLSMDVGASYDIVGQLRYAFGAYQLLPRFPEDLVMVSDAGTPTDPTDPTDPGAGTDTTISALQQSDDSMTCPDDNNIVTVSESVTVEGIVTVEGFDVHDTLNAYGLSDGSAAPYSGLVFVVQKTADEGWSVGQTLKVTGSHLEFYCMTELSATNVELVEATAVDVAPVTVTDLADNAEAYEGMLVTVADVSVTGVDNVESYGEVDTDGGFIIDDWITGKEVLATPEVGAQYCSVTGILSYSFGTFRINPRSASDLVLCD